MSSHRLQPFNDLAPGEVALLLEVSRKTVLRAIAAGELEVIRYSQRCYRIPRESVERWRARRLSSTVTTRVQHGQVLRG